MFKTYKLDQNLSLRKKMEQSLLYGDLHHFFMGIIIMYAAFLSFCGTSFHTEQYDQIKIIVDDFFLIVFALELGLKLWVAPKRFISYSWNLFDLGIFIFTLLIPHAKILRVLRFFIYLHTFVDNPFINRVVHTFLKSLPTIIVSTAVLLVVVFCYSILTTQIFGEDFPELFGHVGRSLYTLFQVMTLESWSGGVVRPVMEIYPWAWVIFISFILVSTYGITNIFVSAVVNAMSFIDRDSAQNGKPSINDLEQQIQELKGLMKEMSTTIAKTNKT